MSTTEETTEYGPLYGSRGKACLVIVQGPEPRYSSNGQRQIGVEKTLVADFAIHGPEYQIPTPDGSTIPFADIHGNFFDLDAAAERNRWTAEEKQAVREKLDWDCERMPNEVWHIVPTLLEAPVPNYDNVHHNTIPEIAVATGLVAEFLAYEKQEKNRPSVVAKLEELLAVQKEQASIEEALQA